MLCLDNGIEVGKEKLLLIAGPCVIENFDICDEIAKFLIGLTNKLGINYVFKASYDKANRTSINSFRGNGMSLNLDILSRVKHKYNLQVLTDIHESEQVAEAAKVADILQIPAFLCRQTDLLKAAGETGKTVNIKKGQFLAPEDMKGALEKIRATGNSRVMLTERGTTFGYHNLVVDMRSLKIMKTLGAPVVFDATHSVQLPGGLGNTSGGQREFVEPLALAATAVGIDALFLEVHPNPREALSDGQNSLDFKMTEQLLMKVKNLHESQRKSFEN